MITACLPVIALTVTITAYVRTVKSFASLEAADAQKRKALMIKMMPAMIINMAPAL